MRGVFCCSPFDLNGLLIAVCGVFYLCRNGTRPLEGEREQKLRKCLTKPGR